MDTPRKVTTASAAHYKWGSNCDGWYFLNTATLSVIKEIMPAGTSERSHLHRKAQQVFYILSGVAVFESGDHKIEVLAHESFYVPPGLVHKISNGGEDDLHFLVISEPRSHEDRMEVD